MLIALYIHLNLKRIEIDETYPEYIQKNKELYQEWILQ